MKSQVAKLNYLKIAPRKVRLLANLLRGLSVQEAEAQLMVRSQRSKTPLLKLLRSAVANAKNNQKLMPERLFVSEIRVDKGPMLKRFLPRAQGRATPIHKFMSHVTLIVSERETVFNPRFTISPIPKKSKSEKPKKTVPRLKVANEKIEVQGKEKKKPGVFKKMFQRKSV